MIERIMSKDPTMLDSWMKMNNYSPLDFAEPDVGYPPSTIADVDYGAVEWLAFRAAYIHPKLNVKAGAESDLLDIPKISGLEACLKKHDGSIEPAFIEFVETLVVMANERARLRAMTIDYTTVMTSMNDWYRDRERMLVALGDSGIMSAYEKLPNAGKANSPALVDRGELHRQWMSTGLEYPKLQRVFTNVPLSAGTLGIRQGTHFRPVTPGSMATDFLYTNTQVNSTDDRGNTVYSARSVRR